MTRKSVQTIDVARLRRTTARNKRRLERGWSAAAAEREREAAAAAEEYGQAKAQGVIPEIPEILKKAASEGRDSACVLQLITSRGDKRAAEIIAAHCESLGLKTELHHYTPGSDDLWGHHDNLIASWEAPVVSKKKK
ncbi:MAG: hypothetical protein A2991_00895 [Candidatus Terrybacteria bacterium RIFCSPLOWO2_01_FULL_58_14]|uniref:Uncharacterized protein n=2 Tax=Candidatus Terryibacteriota TaxID=1817920 RepID=A0A1G2PZN4_9BACT|nr:MAG: hypothetical protein A2682_01345 [Candidatus Terrybacteria bacterium RIFCSPHIGHO2_01_FULL_58_15]OHA53788.1 MAG: hypothetical protein A2991_00895 [Candidatus Terrybacteria bacterium RIFCSPLOWO2_01_FULL_58_14]